MKKEKLYPYEQIDHAVTGNFGGIKEDWEKLNLTKEHVLELYNHVRTYPKGSSMQTQPFDGKQKNVSLTFKAYHDALSDLMEKLSKYAPIRFMKQYEAVFYRKDNLSGIENGLAYLEFLAGAEKATHLVIIDPGPYLVDQISRVSKERDIHHLHERLTLCFTNPLYAEVYKKAGTLRKSWVKAFDEIKFDESDCVHCLYLAGLYREKGSKDERQKILRSNLQHIREKIVFAPKHTLQVLLPVEMMNKDDTNDGLRADMMQSFFLEKICLIDSKAAISSAYKKLAFVTLRIQERKSATDHIQKSKVVLQDFELAEMDEATVAMPVGGMRDSNEERVVLAEGVAKVKVLRCVKEYKIRAGVLHANKATLHELCAVAARENRRRNERASGEPYKVSQEIEFRYSGKANFDGSIKPRIIFQGVVQRIESQHYKEEKKKLHFIERGKKHASRDKMLRHIETLVHSNEELGKMIKQSISNQYGAHPVSLKTFCIVNSAFFLSKNKNEDLFAKVFCKPGSAEYPVCKLLIGTASKEDIIQAVSETTDLLKLSEAEVDSLWHQIHILLNIATTKGLIAENPVIPIINQLDRQEKQEAYFKKNMTEKTLTDEQEYGLVNDLRTNTVEPGLALGVLIKIFTGLSYSEVCASTWQDYFKLQDHDCMVLNIDKRFDDKKTEPIPYLSKLKIRHVPVASFLELLVEGWHNLCEEAYRKMKVSKKDIATLPMIHRVDDPTRGITPDVIRRFGKKYLIKHGPKGLILRMADGRGYKKEFDTSKYGGDFLRENFRDQSLAVAGLEEGEVCFMLGIAPSGTLESNYSGYDKPTRLTRIRDKIDVWAAKRVPALCNVGSSKRGIVLSNIEEKFLSTPTNEPMEMVFRIPIADGMPNFELEIFNRLGFAVTCEWEEGGC